MKLSFSKSYSARLLFFSDLLLLISLMNENGELFLKLTKSADSIGSGGNGRR